MDHPSVGTLTLNREKLMIGGAGGQMLVVYHPDAGTDAAEKLQLLASLTAPEAEPRPARLDAAGPARLDASGSAGLDASGAARLDASRPVRLDASRPVRRGADDARS